MLARVLKLPTGTSVKQNTRKRNHAICHLKKRTKKSVSNNTLYNYTLKNNQPWRTTYYTGPCLSYISSRFAMTRKRMMTKATSQSAKASTFQANHKVMLLWFLIMEAMKMNIRLEQKRVGLDRRKQRDQGRVSISCLRHWMKTLSGRRSL
jgi:hypothetical protein